MNSDMLNRYIPSRHHAAGFTLVELMFVVVLMAVVAASVIPAMDNVQQMRNGAARDDITRMLEITKARAMATGEPMGLRVNLSDSSIGIVELNPTGSATLMSDPLTGRERTINIAATYPGVTIASLNNGDGASGTGIIWFDYEAAPHTRENNGTFIGLNDEPALITISSGLQIVVHAHSGMVETP